MDCTVILTLSFQVLIAFIVGSLFLLAYCSELKQSDTFPSTIKTICGKPTEVASAICIVLYTYGTCITFLIVIDDQLSQCKFARLFDNKQHNSLNNKFFRPCAIQYHTSKIILWKWIYIKQEFHLVCENVYQYFVSLLGIVLLTSESRLF